MNLPRGGTVPEPLPKGKVPGSDVFEQVGLRPRPSMDGEGVGSIVLEAYLFALRHVRRLCLRSLGVRLETTPSTAMR